MSYYCEPCSHSRDKVKVVLDLCNQERIRTCCRCWYISFSCWKSFVALKAEVDKLDIAKLLTVPSSLNNWKAKIDDLDVGVSKTFAIDLKILSDEVDNQVAKNTKFLMLLL